MTSLGRLRAPLGGRIAFVCLTVVALLAVASVTTQREVHAFWWLAPRAVPFLLPAAAESAIAGLIGGTADLSGGGGGGGDSAGSGGGGGYESPKAKAGGRAGRLLELGAGLLGLGTFSFGWKVKDGQDPAYADPPPLSSGTAGWGSPSYDVVVDGFGKTAVAAVTSAAPSYGAKAGVLSISLSFPRPPSGSTTTIVRDLHCKGTGTPTHPYDMLGGTSSSSIGYSSSSTHSNQSVTYDLGLSSSCNTLDRAGFAFFRFRVTTGGSTNTYYSVGHPGYPVTQPVGVTGDVPLTTTTTTACSGGGSSTSTIKYRPIDPTLPNITGSCPAGERVTGVTQVTTRDSDGATVTSPLGTGITSPVIPEAYAQCNPIGSCQLTLLRMSPSADVLANCNSTGACVGWQTQTSRTTGTRTRTVTKADGTTATEAAAVYPDQTWLDCKYGPYAVPVDDCVLVPTEPVTATEAPTEESNCQTSDFSLNPVSWVVVPLKCLFIPRQTVVQAETSLVKDAWDATPPAVAFGIVADVAGPFAALPETKGDCGGPEVTVTMPVVGDVSARPFDACPPLIALVLGWLIPIESAILYLAALVMGSRLVASSAGAASL